MRFRILVCGGRDYSDARRMRKILDLMERRFGPLEIGEGGALGADAGARWYAAERGWSCRTFSADWTRYGASAGPIRNATMLREFEPDYVLAFPGGRGTGDMVTKARAAGVRVGEVA